MGPKTCGVHDDIFGEPRGKGRHTQGVDGVTGVLGVTAQSQSSTTLPEVHVASCASQALSQPEVGPRAVGDCRIRVDKECELFVVEVHGVSDENMRAQNPEGREVLDGTLARSSGISLRVVRRWREVKSNPGSLGFGQASGTDEEVVADQVVSYQPYPAVN